MYAFGATPETSPRGVRVPWSPAAMPATCVAWNEFLASNGLAASAYLGDGGGNARATITFAVVHAVFPLGKPGGIVNPLGLKNGCVWSRPSSMIAILIPLPAVSKAGPHTSDA